MPGRSPRSGRSVLCRSAVLQHLPRHHRRGPQLHLELCQPRARARVLRPQREDLLQRLARVLRIAARDVQVREQVEHRQLGVVPGPALHVGAEEVLDAEVEDAEVGRQPHHLRRRRPVARVVARHAGEVVERLAGVAQLEVALAGLERHPRVGVELRRVGGPLQRRRQARRVAEALELHVRLHRQLQLSLLFQLLRGEHRHRLSAHRGARPGQHRPGLELARLHRRQPRGADVIARPLEELHRARLLAERHEELHGELVLAGAAEQDRRHQRALLAGRIELADLARLHAQRLQQELPGVARPAHRAEQAGGVVDRAGLAEQLERSLALPRLLEPARLLDGLLRVHQSSGSCAARLFSDSGWLANFRASSTVMSPCFTSRKRQASRLCMPEPSFDAVSR